MKYLIIILIFASCFYSHKGNAQQELTLHFLEDISQSAHTNPAFFTERKWVLNLPSFAFNYGNNAFAFRDLIRKDPFGGNYLDVNNVLDKLGPENVLQNQITVDVFRYQFRIKDLYITTSLSENISLRFNYDRDLIDFFWNGNVDYIGEFVVLDPTLRAVYFREIGLGLGYKFGNLKVGVKGHLLEGLADLTLERGNSIVYTNEDDYAVTLYADYLINTAEIPNFQEDPLGNALTFKNIGYSMDVGATYRINKLRVSASLNNLGFIKWKNNVINYSNNETFNYNGLELSNYLQSGYVTFNDLVDSLESTFAPVETENKYRSNLVPQGYFSVFYYFNDKVKTGALLFGEWNEGFLPAYTFFVSNNFTKFFSLGASYSVKNKTYSNVGLSAVFNFKKLQVFAVSDNFVNTISPKTARNINFRWGINLQFYESEDEEKDAQY